NFINGTREICAHKLITNAVEQPMIRTPPMISPQRTLLCSMNAASTSANGLRGVFRTGERGFASSESFAHAPSVGGSLSGGRCAAASGTMNGGLAVSACLDVAGVVGRDLASSV